MKILHKHNFAFIAFLEICTKSINRTKDKVTKDMGTISIPIPNRITQ